MAPAVFVVLSARGMAGPAQKIGATVEVTPVTGPSTLHHLRRTIENSSMGWGGQWSPPANLVTPPRPRNPTRSNPALGGADLYRISCRACHRPDGSASPPEINSIIGPVQAASVSFMTDRMKAMGRQVDAAFIHGLTSANEADLRKRLRAGGHDMPSFDHLTDEEIGALRPYLDQMAGLPGAEKRQRYISEPPARVGELVVKGTCHICHDATGPDSAPTTVLSDIIPPLSSMPRQKTFLDFVRKVREGAPIPLGSAGVSSRGRMPVFNYLTEDEAAAAYSYLTLYPPK
ncbi:MAG TPA: cytochrome c [Vicinamibacterales bacterium]|jgi:mono/diheme cytochrome c family protein